MRSLVFYIGGKKMKKILAPVLLLLAICIACFSGCSVVEKVVGKAENAVPSGEVENAKPSEGLEFAVDEDGACYVKGIGSCTDTNIVIPKKSPDGKDVRKIGKRAFSGNADIETVYIPEGVTTISTSAFSNCTGLTGVSIPKSVNVIEANAFFNCTDLVSVTIPEGVTTINSSSFYKCISLSSVTIPSTVKTIESNAFSTCTRLKVVTIPSSVKTIKMGAFYGCGNLEKVCITDLAAWCDISFEDKNANPLSNGCALYMGDKLVADLVLPAGVSTVRKYAFYNCEGITDVTLSKGVITIEEFAFFGIEDLKTVEVSSSVIAINNSSFAFCEGLESITVDKDNTVFKSIDGNLYLADGTKLLQYAIGKDETSFTIPSSVTSIADYAFANASNLREVSIPEGVVSISDYAFYQCAELTGISIPDSVKIIGNYAFANCGSLQEISLPNALESIGYEAFYGCKGVEYDGAYYIGNRENPYILLLKVADKSIRSHRIHVGTQFIHSGAYWGCNSLEKIIFPESIKGVGNGAFMYCNGLKYVRYVGSKEQWEKIAFGVDNEKMTQAQFVTFDYRED